MRGLLIIMGGLGAAALLSACDATTAQTGDTAVLCPGGSNCPEDGSYVGMLIEEDAFLLARAPAPALTAREGAAAAEDAAEEAAAVLQPPPPPSGPKRVCPQGGPHNCPTDESGLNWKTVPGQIDCEPTMPCVVLNGNPVPTSPAGAPMKKGYVGWLCKKTSPTATNCDDLPQRRP